MKKTGENSKRCLNVSSQNNAPKARIIAFYLPQYHPIPENDEWWGNGFTEWRNVAKARPLYFGHIQPHIPADLGFYDLRVPETRMAQAEMARSYGVEAFCYWHYWFAGRQLLERPFNEVLASGEPDFPFCLGWANQSWSGIWHGAPDHILVEQTYPGLTDYKEHFNALLPAFTDHRYIKVENKPLFVVYRPFDIPNRWEFTDCWRKLAEKAGLPGIYFVGQSDANWNPESDGFDASFNGRLRTTAMFQNKLSRGIDRLLECTIRQLRNAIQPWPLIIKYSDVVRDAFRLENNDINRYPVVIPNWDNTPRCGTRGIVFHGSNPQLFGSYLHNAIDQVSSRDPERRIIILKSWNEWAEGNYMEPDLVYGKQYLEVLKNEICPIEF